MYFILFRSEKNNQWYWSLNADNHETIADGAEGYATRSTALHGISLVKENARSSKIFDESQDIWID
jgi:uncharacterized protein YegP (UPF0339 family)